MELSIVVNGEDGTCPAHVRRIRNTSRCGLKRSDESGDNDGEDEMRDAQHENGREELNDHENGNGCQSKSNARKETTQAKQVSEPQNTATVPNVL